MRASFTAHDTGNFYRSYILLGIFTQSGIAGSFQRRGIVNIRKGEIQKFLRTHVEIMETLVRKTLHHNKILTVYTSLPTSVVKQLSFSILGKDVCQLSHSSKSIEMLKYMFISDLENYNTK